MLHSLPYKETSLVLEIFCKEQGRLPVMAKGAKRPYSVLRSVLVSFQPLQLRFTGKSEVKTLIGAEWAGFVMPPEGKALFAAYYLNELLMHGIQREDPHPQLFDLYASTLQKLSMNEDMNLCVRSFEMGLLTQLGYGLNYQADATGEPLDPQQEYCWVHEHGWVSASAKNKPSVGGFQEPTIRGELILLLDSGVMNRAMANVFRPITRKLLLASVAPNGLVSRAWMEQLVKL